jgi:hypothetical protein
MSRTKYGSGPFENSLPGLKAFLRLKRCIGVPPGWHIEQSIRWADYPLGLPIWRSSAPFVSAAAAVGVTAMPRHEQDDARRLPASTNAAPQENVYARMVPHRSSRFTRMNPRNMGLELLPIFHLGDNWIRLLYLFARIYC